MWLDVARYGEDDYRSLDPMGRGFNPYPNAYLYRDWVIRAFNDDLPYDQFVTAQLAADLLRRPKRVRHLPALGFLGLGPWYYDNGAVEITRADERHDRVDAVSRGFLGLTVGCARCHDHKYDPIPTTRLLRARPACSCNTEYHEYPLAPKAVVDEYKAQGEAAQEEARDARASSLQTEAEQLAETLAFQAAKYMKAAWQVHRRAEERQGRDRRRARSSTTSCSIAGSRSCQKPPMFYPFLKDWQAMIAQRRHGEGSRRRWPTSSRSCSSTCVLEEARDQEGERHHQGARRCRRHKPKEPANLPNEFMTNDDFCPGCGLELRSMPTERTTLWTRRLRARTSTPIDAARQAGAKPGLLRFTGWGLEQRLGADRRALDRGAAQRHRGDGEGAAAEVRLRARRARRREAGRPEGAPARQPDAAWATRCRAASSRC